MQNDRPCASEFYKLLKLSVMKLVCCLTAFAGGVLVGGIAAMLFAPKKGEDLRREIKQKVNDAKERIASEDGCCKSGTTVVKDDVVVSFEE